MPQRRPERKNEGGSVIALRFPMHWEALKQIRQLKNLEPTELARRIDSVIEYGSRLRERPNYEDRVSDCVFWAEKALLGMLNFERSLSRLPELALVDFQNVLFDVCGPKAALTEGLSIKDVQRLLRENLVEVQLARLILGHTMNVTLDPFSEVKPKRQVQTEFLDPIAHSIMHLWEELSGKRVVSAKGLTTDGPFGARPQKDDAFFVYLCLNMIADVDASKTITAIRRVQKKDAKQTNHLYAQELAAAVAERLAKNSRKN